MLRYLTGGESHGRAMTIILEGLPSGLFLKAEDVDVELARRQKGYGRGGRMAIERDRAEFLSGVRSGQSLGSPITMIVKNLDWENWSKVMSSEFRVQSSEQDSSQPKDVTRPRPGHADLSGAMKYNFKDVRNILERSSARETSARVAAGAVCKKFLDEFGIRVLSWVVEIGGAKIDSRLKVQGSELEDIFASAEESDVRCPDEGAAVEMRERIDDARKDGNSVGGVFEVVVVGVPPGLGSHVHWDRKLNARLAQAVMSIQAIKGVEVGLGFEAAKIFGSEVHDEIYYRGQGSGGKGQEKLSGTWPFENGFYRKTNNAGGIEGGMSNGEPILLRAAMKPIPTLTRALQSVDIVTKKSFEAAKERSDVCAVPAASVVGEAVVAFEIARAFLEKFGGDSMEEAKRNYQGYLEQLRSF